jgi:TolA-binding protein
LREEAALLRQAIHGLRVARRPSEALARLAEHRRRFPSGALATDAQILRVEALLALGRRGEARVALDDHRLAGEGNGRSLQVTRAELLADRSCSEAIAVFDDLLQDPSASAATIERALRGRAICRARTGNLAAAIRDWENYLTRFPTGRFAAEARRHLAR